MGLTRIRAEQISDIDYKQAVRVIQRTNINLTGGAPSSVDSVNLSANDRVLVSGQSSAAENGIYRVQSLGQGENGTWVRTSDANADGEIEAGMIIMVTEGDVYKDTQWKLTTNNPIIIGTTPLTFVLNAVSVIGGENTQVQYNQSGVLAGSANLTFDGTNLTVGGNVTANYFVGNGSQLTGISTSTSQIFNGTSNVNIATANANVTVSVDGTSDVVVISAGLLDVDGNVSANYFLGNGSQLTGIQAGATVTVANTAPVGPVQGDVWIDSDTGTQLIYFTSGGNSQWAEMEAEASFNFDTTYSNANVDAYLPVYSGNVGDGSGYIFGNGSQLVGLPASYGNADAVAYGETGWAGNIIPSANVTYSLGTSANRWQDLWLANSTIYIGETSISSDGANLELPSNVAIGAVTMSTSTGSLDLPVGTTVGGSLVETPKIANLQITDSSWTVLDDTAISTSGGYFIINGSGFQSGATVVINNTPATAVTVVNSNVLRCQVGAASAGSYIVYASNPDGGLAIKPAGLTYSATPSWVTGTSLPDAQSGQAYSTTLSATDATSYQLAAGNSLPTGMTLAGNGLISGTSTVESNTTYNFTVNAIDAEAQDSPRTFSLIVSVEPPLGSFYNGGYYAGRIAISGSIYRIIVAPKATGESYRQLASASSAYLALNQSGRSVTAAQARSDGWYVTNTMVSTGQYPAANWARGLTINGYSDWYIASLWEFWLCFATFKPTTANNDNVGNNIYTRTPGWPPNTTATSNNPARTSNTLFQAGGAQVWQYGGSSNSTLYYTTNKIIDSSSAYVVSFDSGDSVAGRGFTDNGYWSVGGTESMYFRVIRRELVGPA